MQLRNLSGREEVIQFVRDWHAKSGRMPSVRNIVKGLRTTNNFLYGIFPGGSEEIARLASVPITGNLLRGIRSPNVSKTPAPPRTALMNEFEAGLEVSKTATRVSTLMHSFLSRTEHLEGDPYWSGKRDYVAKAALSAIELTGKADPDEAVRIERKFRDEVKRLLTIASYARGLYIRSRRMSLRTTSIPSRRRACPGFTQIPLRGSLG